MTGPFAVVDLDGDGRDERVHYYQRRGPFSADHGIVSLWESRGGAIEQLNYPAVVLEPSFLDLEDDGRPEILVPLVRHDSLFVTFANGKGEKLFHFFLATGEPRKEPEGELPWDPQIVDFHLVDADGDEKEDLVTVFNSGYARLPRGVLVHRLRDGEPLGRWIIGAGIWQSKADDFDGDGREELLLSTASTNNGADAGGFDDAHSHLILLEFTPAPEVVWAEVRGPEWWATELAQGDFDGDGRPEVLVGSMSWGGRGGERARFEVLEPRSWKVAKRFASDDELWGPIVADLDHDARPEILLMHEPSELRILDGNLKLLKRRRLPHQMAGAMSRPLRILPDLDEDGEVEIALDLAEGLLLLRPDLRTMARQPAGRFAGILRGGLGTSPAVVVESGRTWVTLDLVENPFFWVYRYGPLVLILLVFAGGVGGTSWLLIRRRRWRLLRALQERELESGAPGLMLLDSRGRVRWSNTTLRRWLASGDENDDRLGHLDAVAARSPKLAAFCRAALVGKPPERISEERTLLLGNRRRPVRVVAQPVLARVRGDPHWLIRVCDPRHAEDPDVSRTWAMMAQRVAHRVKNPLTSILLTLQRLQMEYHEQAPAVANRLDRYSARIEGRIEELRQLTSNFLKFVDLEDPELVETDLNELVRGFNGSCRRGLPPDIRLALKLAPNLPRVEVDRGQIESLLDNLVTNAVNAMPDGGAITISTAFVREARMPSQPDPRDYLQLEVLDTGKGVPTELKERLFEPGVSGQEEGSGLGLAIAAKIARDHGGEIAVESEPGTGSAFSIYLPVRGAEITGSSTGSGRATGVSKREER